MKIFLIASYFLFFVNFIVLAQPYAGKEGKKVVIPPKSAGCEPPNATTRMEANNVRMLVHTAGNMWHDFPLNRSVYEVPKNSGIMCLFTSALWLGGTDVNGQLKLAALRYRQGQDYWTGPLIQSSAAISPDVCEQYDKHFVSSQEEVREFVAWYDAGQADLNDGTNTQSANFPNFKIPQIVKDWPAHGDVTLGQEYYLAPFFDRNLDGDYRWEDGDYPWYDIDKSKDCRTDRRVSLYGDLNYWWVMNDNGNLHTETNSDPIGMEIRGQAFAFTTNDEINNMTFYNYELINRGSLTLFNTYFGFFTDGALGDPFDDFVGCDVNRGLAYYYNGNSFDGDAIGFKGYGDSPPAVGVDFFEGPFQDDDGVDNAFGIGQGEALNGIGYGDGIVDNERFGMRRFLYYSNSTNGSDPSQTDPEKATDYYNYLRGIWKDGTPFYYGGSGHISDQDANPNQACDFMFPGDTDPLGWGTGGNPQLPWTEETAGNVPNDRRFVQSAGPFILRPGSVNNITVGVAWARTTSGGGPFESVEVLRRADDKAQALFENCFRIIEGPHAPDLQIQELENELILTLSNPPSSNNSNEDYEEIDPYIISSDPNVDKLYRFQGYQIFQLSNIAVSVSELNDPSKARLVAQCDIKDEAARLINFERDEDLNVIRPVEKVNGANEGIRRSFQISEDLFAQGERRLVNFKRYYYMAIAYSYNNFKTFIPNDPLNLDGQRLPYLSSRKASIGEVKVIEAIPHAPIAESGGTFQFSNYGETPEITRIDGFGNGGRILELTEQSEEIIVQNGFMPKPIYKRSFGPINVKVVDPLNVADGYFECEFLNYTTNAVQAFAADSASWVIHRYSSGGDLLESVVSERTIAADNEQLIPQWGVSVQIHQNAYFKERLITGGLESETTDILEASINFADSSKRWLSFIPDQDNYSPLNWIRSGTFDADSIDFPYVVSNFFSNPQCYKDEVVGSGISRDPDKRWSRILGGGLAPHALVGYQCDFMPLAYWRSSPLYPASQEPQAVSFRSNAVLSFTPSIDLVITSDRSKWTRCAVIELGRDQALNVNEVPQPTTIRALPGGLRKSRSVGKDGKPDGTGFGMSWFPGYAIDVESGVRLNMAFGENSFLASNNGADMIWNPTSNLFGITGNPLLGGMHPVYVFSYKQQQLNGLPGGYNMGAYTSDGAELKGLFDLLETTNDGQVRTNLYSSLSWVGYPILAPNRSLFETDVRLRVRLNKEYKTFNVTGENQGRPKYGWSMDGLAPVKSSREALAEVLSIINIVPNPYLAFSEYERNRLETRVKITNLPEVCTIRIYSSNGRLVKSFKKSNTRTFLDWELKNEAEIWVSSGVYLVHIDVPDVGERVLKFFMGSRSPDYEGL